MVSSALYAFSRLRPAGFCIAALLATLTVGAARAQTVAPAGNSLARQIVSDPKFRAAVGVFDRDFERFVAELIKLTEIPAPPFGEEPRARAYMAMLKDAGLENVEMDAEGNVMGLRRGKSGGAVPLLAVAAHLDTVFPEGTDVKVKRQGTRLLAPGIGDDTRGLAFVLALIIGGVSGYYGGWIDSVIQMITDAFRTVPAIPLFMAVAAFMPPEISAEARFFYISIILGFIGWPTLARRIRTHLLTERNQEYVLAAQLCGASSSHVIRRHLLPSFTSYIIVDLVISFPYMVLSETALSFIG